MSRDNAGRLRLVQVGMGGWGRDWMSVTATAGTAEPVAWVDPSDAARAATVALGAPPDCVFADLRAALAATDAQAVLVTTPVEHHVPVALEAVDAALPVLLEKPFAPSLGDAVTAIRAADAAGRTLMVSQNYRYHPAPRLAASLVAGGRLGEVASVEIDFRRNGIRDAGVLRRHRAMVHPLLVDMAIHQFDLLRLVVGRDPEWVDVTPVTHPSTGYEDPPAAFITIGVAGGVVASYRGSWVSTGRRTPWGGDWRIEGSAGGLEFSSRGDLGVDDRLRLRTRGGAARPQRLPDVGALDRAGALAAFVEAVGTGHEPETSGRRNLPTLAVTLAAVRSATERRRVDVAELLDELPEDLR